MESSQTTPVSVQDGTKKCPFCAEQIQAEAIKCRYCGEFLDNRRDKHVEWYFKTGNIVISFLFVGPFALLLVWFHPRYNKATKIIITVIVSGITALLVILLVKLVPDIIDYYRQLQQISNQL